MSQSCIFPRDGGAEIHESGQRFGTVCLDPKLKRLFLLHLIHQAERGITSVFHEWGGGEEYMISFFAQFLAQIVRVLYYL